MRETTLGDNRISMLRSVRGFSALSDIDLMNISEQLRWDRIDAGYSLTSTDDDGRRIFLICRGTVRAIIYTENGREITYEEFRAGNFVGEVSAIDNKPRPVHVVAARDSVVASMDSVTFGWVMRRYPTVATEVALKMCETIRGLSQRIYEMYSLPVARRIDLDLCRLADRYSSDGVIATIDPAPKHAEIASRVNTQRETVTKRISSLRKLGLVRTDGRQFVVYDLRRLRRVGVHGIA